MSHKLKKIAALTTAAAAGMYCMNRVIDYTAGLKNLLTTDDGEIYPWKNGKIFYTVSGKGSPLLLIHDLDPASSSTEWNKVLYRLEKKHTVYTMDLLGCGRSDKPGITYTNYLYVQLINDFITNIIKEPADVVVTGLSASFTVMAQAMNPDNYKKIILVNPTSISALKATPEQQNRIVKFIFEIPILGTFLYNILMHESKIHTMFENKYFYKKSLISTKLEDIYFEAAHKDKSAGKYLLASIESNFLNVDISNTIKNAEHLYILSSHERKDVITITDNFLHLNKNIEASYITNSRFLPQLEVPEKFFEVTQMFLDN